MVYNYFVMSRDTQNFFGGKPHNLRYVYFMLKKAGVVFAACICFLMLTISANANTISKGVVTADALNIRSMPSTEGAKLGLLPTNAGVIILSQHDNWYKIFYNGIDAYVCADYVTIYEANVPFPTYQPETTQSSAPVATTPAPTPVVSTPAPLVSTPVTVPATAPTGAAAIAAANSYKVPAATGTIPSYGASQIPGERLVELSKQFIGTPYLYGGMSPAGFDCSGFVKYCYSLMGINVNRVSSDQALNGVEVPVDQMLPGDILCFASAIGSDYIGHTGIYVGNGYFIHSPRTGYNVEIVALDATSYCKRILNVRRIF